MLDNLAPMSSRGRPTVALRMDPDLVDELDRLATLGSTPVRQLTRADVIRYILSVGIDQVRAEFEAEAKKRGN